MSSTTVDVRVLQPKVVIEALSTTVDVSVLQPKVVIEALSATVDVSVLQPNVVIEALSEGGLHNDVVDVDTLPRLA